MALPAIVIPLVAAVGKKTAVAIGLKTLKAAWAAGGVKGLLTAIAKGVGAFIVKAWSATAIVQFLMQQAVFIYQFNWNISDEELDTQIQGNLNQLAGLAGSAVGQTLGWITCGAVAGAVVAKINPAALAVVLDDLAEEAAEEIIAVWSSLIRSTAQISARSFFLWAYKNVRSFIKKNWIFQSIFGAEKLAQWGKGPPVSIAKTVEDAIESIPNETLRNFVESAYEEFWDACAEASFVVASSLDVWNASQRQTMRENVLGRERIVEVTLDREVPEERIVLAGNERVLMPQISGLINTHRLLSDKDVGEIIGQPADAHIQRKVPSSTQLEIIVKFYNAQRPPLPRGPNLVEATYTIPNISRAALDWERIKLACGGVNGFDWGPHRCTANLSNGGQMAVYGGSYADAKNLIERFLTLTSDLDVKWFSKGEEDEGGNRSLVNNNIKRLTRLYPYSVTVIRTDRTTNPELGRVRLTDGNRVQFLKRRFYLWPDIKPVGFDEGILELLSENR